MDSLDARQIGYPTFVPHYDFTCFHKSRVTEVQALDRPLCRVEDAAAIEIPR